MRRAFFWLASAVLVGGLWYAAETFRSETAEPPRRPSETGWIQRTFPHFQADASAYRQAFVEARALRRAAKTSSAFGTWEFVGPTDIGGRVSDVVYDPTNPQRVYAAAATGGVFRSDNGGVTWTPIFDEQPVLTIGDIALDPVNPQIIYVGTGEANGGHNNFAGSGLYKSTDGGDTWTLLGLPVETTSIGRIRIDPENPQRLFVAAVGSYFEANPERGVYRSDDGGLTWEQVLFVTDEVGAIDLVMDPTDPDVLLAAMWQRVRRPSGATLAGPQSSIWKTTDGGDTWRRLGAEEGLPRSEAGRIGLAICETQPNVVYALFTDGFTYLGLYRSDDGGESWRDVDRDQDLQQAFRGFSWYFGQVRVHPTDPDHVYVMDVQLARSTNGGTTWQFMSGTHVDYHALDFHPTEPNVMIVGNDGGLALSGNGGTEWVRVESLPVTQFYEIGIDPNDPERLYGGTQDNGTIRRDGTDNWQPVFGGDGFYVIVDPRDSNTIYVESQNGNFAKLVDGRIVAGTTGIPDNEPRNWSTPFAMDPQNPDVLYLGTDRLYRTINGAASWEAVSHNLTKNLGLPLIGTISTIAVAPTNSAVIYVGTDDGNVWVSSDRAETWRNITKAPLPFRWVSRVVADPRDASTAYATFSGLKWRDPESHVFRTRDQGETWEDISANLPDAPVNAFAVDPANSDYLYVGTDIGAFGSVDGGESWEALGEGLPAVSVYDFKIYEDETQRFLVAGTHGRSMYRLDLSSVPVATEDPPAAPARFALEAAYPNPFTTRTTVPFHLGVSGQARLEVFDVLGRRVAVVFDGPVAPGTHRATWEAGTAAPGAYLARLTVMTPAGEEQQRTTMLTRLR